MEDKQVATLASGSMPGINFNFSPVATPSPQPRFHTPSPFSVASTTWSARPPLQNANLFLRILALILSFGSAISLTALSSTNTQFRRQSTSFLDYPDLLYCFAVNVLVFLYAVYQLFKGVFDMAHRGVLITDRVSDYISFIFDQLAGYLLVSASSAAVPTIRLLHSGNPLKRESVVSVSLSFTLFLVIAVSTLLSGYKLCKRIM